MNAETVTIATFEHFTLSFLNSFFDLLYCFHDDLYLLHLCVSRVWMKGDGVEHSVFVLFYFLSFIALKKSRSRDEV